MAKSPHFDISAAVVRQLGDELVSDEVTALVELVKNAYDADATYANVTVNTKDPPPLSGTQFPKAQGYISIEDDGFGMDAREIEQGWLVISLSTKRGMKRRGEVTPKGRTPLGDKGLGRLSTQKLGNNLEMVTRKDGTPDTLHVSFSWTEFTDERSLGTVPVRLRPSKLPRRKGTALVISGLRNPAVWSGAALGTLTKDLAQIISPFPEARPFTVSLTIDGVPLDLGQVSAAARQAAAGKFEVDYLDGVLLVEGRVRLDRLRGQNDDFFDKHIAPSQGRDFFRYLQDQKPRVLIEQLQDGAFFVGFHRRLELGALPEVRLVSAASGRAGEKIPADPGPFHAEIDEFVFRSSAENVRLSGLSSASELRELVRQHAGIKIFRDGFGIRPYGINGEDWLGLGVKQTSGSSWYGLRPNNVIGFVAISESRNPELKDKTDREGLVSNPYSDNFRRLMREATATIDDFYEWLRRSYNEYRKEMAHVPGVFGPVTNVVTDAATVARTLDRYRDRGRTVVEAASALRSQLTDITEKIRAEPGRGAAADRKLLGLINQARYVLEKASTAFDELEQYVQEAAKLAAIVETLHPRLAVLTDQLEDFSELAGLGLIAEALSHEVLNQTDRLTQVAKAASRKARTSVPPNVDLLGFAEDVSFSAVGLKRQIGHLGPSLRYQRDKIETFPVGKLIADTEAHFRDRFLRRDLAIRVSPGGGDFSVRTNRGRLTQVLDNLVLNSEYWLTQQKERTARPGSVSVEIERPLVRLWDDGPGIDASVEETLFEPFVTLKPRDRGRGLGLFVCRQILESMGCSITLLPDRNPQGRRYVFQLNLAAIAV